MLDITAQVYAVGWVSVGESPSAACLGGQAVDWLLLFLRRLLNRNLSLYAQLDTLAECGIVPNDGVGVRELLSRYSEREYETTPFKRLLSALGEEAGDAARTSLSTNIWHARAGCISGPGDYVHVADRVAILASGYLPLADVSDEFDLRRGVAWLQFRLRDQEFRWPARIQERWIDATILSRFVRLLAEQETDRRFTFLDLGGQDCLIGCATPEQFRALRKWTGLNFEWLD